MARALLCLPVGGYVGLTWNSEGPSIGQFFQDHGIAAFVVKYRLPTDATMVDKSIGPLQDAQQAMIVVRQRAKDGILTRTVLGSSDFQPESSGFDPGDALYESYVPNPDQISLRPDFMILLYPVISMDPKIAHMGSVLRCLGRSLPTSKCSFSRTSFR